jgi:hypothetical protein
MSDQPAELTDAQEEYMNKLIDGVKVGVRYNTDTFEPATVFDLAIAQLTLGEYANIRYTYKSIIQGTITEYFYTDNVSITRFRNVWRKAVQEAFYPAFEMGLVDGGGESPAVEDDLAWINAKADAERGFVDELFQRLKELKKLAAEEGRGVLEGVAEARSEGYARTLDGVYSEGKIRGAKNQMLTFGGSDGFESCRTCQRLKGQRHRASWWKSKGLIPGQPGNDNYDCGGYQCQHILFNDKGEIFNV